MDLRVLCVFVAVAYVDVSARITCNFQPKSWTAAMQQCLFLSGNPVSISSVLSPTGLHLNGSFWTADYASRIATSDSPVECEYRTLNLFNQISQEKFGNCEELRNCICCDNNITKSCVKYGTWKEASRCNYTYQASTAVMPLGDYWLRGAFRYQNYTLTGFIRQSINRCGLVDVYGNFQFVSDCGTSHYSFCDVGNNTGSDLSVCLSTITTKQPSSNTTSFTSQNTETLTATSMSINENTTIESINRNRASSSSDFKTGTTVQHKTETLTATSVSINEETSSSSDFKTVTAVQQQTKTLTATRVSINDDTSTESKVPTHDSNSSASALGIGLGVSLSIVIIVIITIIGVCVYIRRKRNANCEGIRKEFGRTELGEIYVYDEISNNEESADTASKVDIYDKISRTDGEQEHAYESVTSAPRY